MLDPGGGVAPPGVARLGAEQWPEPDGSAGAGCLEPPSHVPGAPELGRRQEPQRRPCRPALLPGLCCSLTLWRALSGALALAVVVLLAAWPRQPAGTCWALDGSEKCATCPEDWIRLDSNMIGGRCYYFSSESEDWDTSRDICGSYNATLAMIKEQPVLEHIKRLRQPEYYYWIGLRKGPMGQQWEDGSLFTGNSLENEGPNPDCVYLNAEKLVAVECTSVRNWICVKELY